MKNLISHVRFRMVLLLLFLAVLLTLPAASTGSKYVWNDTIDISLTIVCQDSTSTSGGSGKNSLAIYPSVYWAQELEHMEAEATEEGLVLTAEDGYTLPESLTVTIGQASFLVHTDGTKPLEGITFDATSGLLSISESLIAESSGGVTVHAAAVPKVVSDEGMDEPVEDDGDSNESTPASEGTSAGEDSYTGEKPTAGDESADGTIVVFEEVPSM